MHLFIDPRLADSPINRAMGLAAKPQRVMADRQTAQASIARHKAALSTTRRREPPPASAKTRVTPPLGVSFLLVTMEKSMALDMVDRPMIVVRLHAEARLPVTTTRVHLVRYT